jgi:hypothetical protein
VGHVDDARSTDAVLGALREIHGAEYAFAVRRWEGETRLGAPDGRVAYRFVIEADDGQLALARGALVRGPSDDGPYRRLEQGDGEFAEVIAAQWEAVWPGDVLATDGCDGGLLLSGRGTYLEVVAEANGYRAPALAMLRQLPDHPRGCAAYAGAFRRETLPPERGSEMDAVGGQEDRRGVNRANEHTLDMRFDRVPGPTTHYHAPVPLGGGRQVNHSETAIVLRRSTYGLPEVNGSEAGHAIIYRRPAEDPKDTVRVPLRPGSIVVTPAATGWQMGHQFENAFAMLVAIPGFVSPTTYIEPPAK